MPLPIIDPKAVYTGTPLWEGSSQDGGSLAGTVRYAISDLDADVATFGSDAQLARRMRWAADLRRWADQGIDFIQLREKTLHAGDLFELAKLGVELLKGEPAGNRPKLLINSRPDIAVSAGADGIHLTAHPGELRPAQVREIFRAAALPPCVISVSCHDLDEAARARENGADLILFGPVFEKRVRGEQIRNGNGLATLRTVCERVAPLPVFALGGVDTVNATSCLSAGASGIAGIRLFAGSTETS